MKKTILWIILVLIIFIIGYFLYLHTENQENFVYLGLSDAVKFLDECVEQSKLNYSNIDEKYLACVEKDHIPSQKDVEKLRLLKDLNGIKICEYSREETPCHLSFYSAENCEEIWKITYYTMGVKPCPNSFLIFKCENVTYLHYSFISLAGPPEGKIYKIQINEDTAHKLKE
jgi:hypothetical protein